MELACSLEQPEQHTWTVAWYMGIYWRHPNGRILASAGSDRRITIWELSQALSSAQKVVGGCIIQQVIGGDNTKSIRCLAFSPDGRMLCSGSFDSTLVVYVQAEDGYSLMARLEGHENEVKCVAWSPSGKKIASCSRDKNVWVWEIDEAGEDFLCGNVLEGHTQDVKWVGWMSNHSLASAAYDDTIRVWEYDDDDIVCKQVLEGHASTVWALAFKKELIVSVGEDQSLRVWQSRQGSKYTQTQEIPNLHERAIYACDFNAEQTLLATGGGDNHIVLSVHQ